MKVTSTFKSIVAEEATPAEIMVQSTAKDNVVQITIGAEAHMINVQEMRAALSTAAVGTE